MFEGAYGYEILTGLHGFLAMASVLAQFEFTPLSNATAESANGDHRPLCGRFSVSQGI
jgi:hypothetical protein